MSAVAETVTTLEALRREIAKQRAKAALIPGLPNLLTIVETHLVASENRFQMLERRVRSLETLSGYS